MISVRRMIHVGALLGAALCSGCVFYNVPVPAKHATSWGKEIKAEDLSSFQTNRTSRREVIARLGQPVRQVEDKRVDIYWWLERIGRRFVGFVVLAPHGPGAADSNDIERTHAVIVHYDHAGRLQRIEKGILPKNWHKGAWLDEWIAGEKSMAKRPSNTVRPATNK